MQESRHGLRGLLERFFEKHKDIFEDGKAPRFVIREFGEGLSDGSSLNS
jgi:hypothetical protein